MITPARFSNEEKRALWIVSAVILLSRSAFALLPDRLLFGTVYGDDGFYGLTVARHLALGQGFTVDGIHATNGFQPLMVLLQSLCFLVSSDRFDGLRVTFVLVGLIEVAFVWAVATLLLRLDRHPSYPMAARRTTWWRSAPVLAAVMQTFVFSLLAVHANGLETGLYALTIVLLLLSYAKIQKGRANGGEPTLLDLASLGILGGFVALSRVDGAVLVLIVALLEIRFRNGIRNTAIVGGIALIVSGPWWLFGLHHFGSLMPISGQAESVWTWHAQSLLDGANAMGDIFLFFIPRWRHVLPLYVAIPLEVVVIVWIVRIARRSGIAERVRSSFDFAALLPLLLFGCFLVVYYLFFFGSTWFLDRYWHPIELLWILLVVMSLPFITSKVITRFQMGRPAASWAMRRYAYVSALAIVIAINLRADRSVYLPVFPTGLAEIGFWARARPSVSIGTMQSGTAGYLADNVTNLDGKVNFEALVAIQRDTLGGYIRRMHFDYIADEPDVQRRLIRAAAKYGVHYVFEDSIRYARFYRRVN